MRFKAETIEQFKILKYIEEILDTNYITIKLVDRYTVQVTDMDEKSIRYIYKNGEIAELPPRDPGEL
ncbi:Hypothetical protein DPCES_1428 [Desulfitobacterium hafniense]|uniref:Uncharacterized protein n=1 Tax=Desulfitobacterium hafniense TaxID=49338 RepID=A0A098AYW8_DESHA|nr:hypothetical protein [Desulfitobacterium hafniense]CDX01315.1 Hypothetical protein DPCES_1428 [Desulfitobacterium hafniense]